MQFLFNIYLNTLIISPIKSECAWVLCIKVYFNWIRVTLFTKKRQRNGSVVKTLGFLPGRPTAWAQDLSCMTGVSTRLRLTPVQFESMQIQDDRKVLLW